MGKLPGSELSLSIFESRQGHDNLLQKAAKINISHLHFLCANWQTLPACFTVPTFFHSTYSCIIAAEILVFFQRGRFLGIGATRNYDRH